VISATRQNQKNYTGGNENSIKYELFGCARALQPRWYSRGFHVMSWGYATATLKFASGVNNQSASQPGAGASADKKAVRCILDCVPKMELLENVSFGGEPDASELQTAHLPSNRL